MVDQAADVPPEPRTRLLAEMVREAERVIDQQVLAAEDLDDKNSRVTAIAQAAFAGTFLLFGLIADKLPSLITSVSVALVAAGGALNLVALLLSLGVRRSREQRETVHAGPSLGWVSERARDTDWALPEHYLTLLVGFAQYEAHNQELMNGMADRRRRNLLWLSFGILLYVIALLSALIKAYDAARSMGA